MESKPILTMDDPWYSLRQELFGNVEPEVRLEGVTSPLELNGDIYSINSPVSTYYGDTGLDVDWKTIEQLPALAAGTSYGSKEKLENDPDRAIKLNKKLIELGHHVPLEIVTYVFNISGISKACGAQLSRYRHTGHVSASRRYQQQKPAFVYPMLSYIKDKDSASTLLTQMEIVYQKTHAIYQLMRGESDCVENNAQIQDYLKHNNPIHKEDARLIMPVASATERTWWCNARELRHIFSQRLAKDAEWEIRRLAQMLFNIVYPLTPSLFEDIKERFESWQK